MFLIWLIFIKNFRTSWCFMIKMKQFVICWIDHKWPSINYGINTAQVGFLFLTWYVPPWLFSSCNFYPIKWSLYLVLLILFVCIPPFSWKYAITSHDYLDWGYFAYEFTLLGAVWWCPMFMIFLQLFEWLSNWFIAWSSLLVLLKALTHDSLVTSLSQIDEKVV